MFGNTEISTNTRRIRHQRHEYTLTVGSKTVRVPCVNKREGKQKASQEMLKEIFSKEASNSDEVKFFFKNCFLLKSNLDKMGLDFTQIWCCCST